jgi:hypothetical protein
MSILLRKNYLNPIWLHMNCQQSNLPSALCVENCCTKVDKIHSKTEAYLIQFSWNFYRNLCHKSRACIPNFKPIQIDLVTQAWLRSQLAQIFAIKDRFQSLELYFIKCELTLKLTCLNTLTRHIHSIHLLKVILWIYPTQINPNLTT